MLINNGLFEMFVYRDSRLFTKPKRLQIQISEFSINARTYASNQHPAED